MSSRNATADLFHQHDGDTPLLIDVPHAGTKVPEEIRGRMTDVARQLPDTDWYVDRLWGFATELGASLQVATHSRYVIDLNRPPDDAALYASGGSGLVPERTFSGEPLYRQGRAPDHEEKAERLERYWRPYHQHLQDRLDRLREIHGHVVLLDAHSIRSSVPSLFEGQLPALNLGAFDGQSAAADLIRRTEDSLESEAFARVTDARFKGGYITRHYGRPDADQHALQLEIAQRAYMQEQPPDWDRSRAQELQVLLQSMIEALCAWVPQEGRAAS